MKPSKIISFLTALNTIRNCGMDTQAFRSRRMETLWIYDKFDCLHEISMYQYPTGVKLIADSSAAFEALTEFNKQRNQVRKMKP